MKVNGPMSQVYISEKRKGVGESSWSKEARPIATLRIDTDNAIGQADDDLDFWAVWMCGFIGELPR